jgi:hypothetical protein
MPPGRGRQARLRHDSAFALSVAVYFEKKPRQNLSVATDSICGIISTDLVAAAQFSRWKMPAVVRPVRFSAFR